MLDKHMAIVGKSFPSGGIHKCLSVTMVDKISEDSATAIGVVTFEGFDALIFTESANDLLQFVNKNVVVSFRTEVVQGVIRVVIDNIAECVKVATLDRDEGYRLYLDEESELQEATASFRDVKKNQTAKNCALYCISVTRGESPRTNWVDLLCYDRKYRIAKVRVFNPIDEVEDFKESYIVGDLTLTEYGLQTGAVYRVRGADIPVNPLVEMAYQYIMAFLEDLPVGFVEALNKISFFDKLKQIDCGIELIELAIAISLSREFANVSRSIDMGVLTQGIIASKFHLLSQLDLSTSSKERRGLLVALSSGWRDNKMLHMIDGDTDKSFYEKHLMEKILDTAAFINDVERKVTYNNTVILPK